jgi:hypothetical protein
MADALAQFGYAVGVELNSTVTPLSSKLDTVISLLSSAPSSTSRPSAGVAPTTVTRIAAIASRKQRQGMCAKTGRRLTGVDHLKQSIADILHTRIGSRVMRRMYGSNLFERIDQPQNDLTRVGIIADIAEALEKWEPRFRLKQVKLTGTTEEQSNGKLFCTLRGDYNGAEISVGVAA